MARKIISARLTPQQLKKLRAKPFLERNKIIQDKLDMEQRERVMELRMAERRRQFIF